MIEDEIKQILKKYFSTGLVELTNESHLHKGHAGSPNTGQSHFNVRIISDEFESLSKVQRHQKVYSYLNPLFLKGLHALTMQLYTQKEYNSI
jgi:stress-induced morphogen